MSKEIILKIKETEAQAQKIKADALEEAAARVRRAQLEGQRACDKAEADAEKMNRDRLKTAADRAEGIIDEARSAALTEAENAREAAEFNIREAVRFIIAGVYEQCQ